MLTKITYNGQKINLINVFDAKFNDKHFGNINKFLSCLLLDLQRLKAELSGLLLDTDIMDVLQCVTESKSLIPFLLIDFFDLQVLFIDLGLVEECFELHRVQLGFNLASEIGLSSRFCPLENTHQIVKVALSSSGKITFAQNLQWEVKLR